MSEIVNFADYMDFSDRFSVEDGNTVYDVRTFYCDESSQCLLEQMMQLLKSQIA